MKNKLMLAAVVTDDRQIAEAFTSKELTFESKEVFWRIVVVTVCTAFGFHVAYLLVICYDPPALQPPANSVKVVCIKEIIYISTFLLYDFSMLAG